MCQNQRAGYRSDILLPIGSCSYSTQSTFGQESNAWNNHFNIQCSELAARIVLQHRLQLVIFESSTLVKLIVSYCEFSITCWKQVQSIIVRFNFVILGMKCQENYLGMIKVSGGGSRAHYSRTSLTMFGHPQHQLTPGLVLIRYDVITET